VRVRIRKNLPIAFGLCVILFGALASASQGKRKDHPTLSLSTDGRGADHVMVVVRDIHAAS
jgi:hypothetical protein